MQGLDHSWGVGPLVGTSVGASRHSQKNQTQVQTWPLGGLAVFSADCILSQQFPSQGLSFCKMQATSLGSRREKKKSWALGSVSLGCNLCLSTYQVFESFLFYFLILRYFLLLEREKE